MKTRTKLEKMVYKVLVCFSEELKSGEFTATDIRKLLSNQQSQPLRQLTMLSEDDKSTYKNINNRADHLVSVEAQKVIAKGSLTGLTTEHLVPMKVILDELVRMTISDELTMESMQEVIYCGQVAYITKEETILIDSEYRSDMPEGWEVGDSPLIRAAIAGIEWV